MITSDRFAGGQPRESWPERLRRHWISLVVCLGICQLIGAAGGLISAEQVDGWYRTLTLPQEAPPAAVFPVVWTCLFILMGVSLWLVWQRRSLAPRLAKAGIALFAAQLVLNFLWSLIFFGLHQLGWAVVEIVVLWTTIVATAIAFRKISGWAAWLLLPYVAWVGFATYLTIAIWRLNGGR